ncbi:phosphate ABC transporter substrate-binding protein PstS [Hydrogenophaga sp. ZJX-1]|uniref:phosphate ABC transporter substrate-binding protein PstS n=1 Tax=Hydrogenophaga sp. ZJX-1 TaxID=3404778 RepID=UPI003B28D180
MNVVVNTLRRLALAALLCPLTLPLVHAQGAAVPLVAGAGATFPAQIYLQWSEHYRQARGVELRYQPTGSGDGIRQISERKVALAGTDSPLSPAELAKRRLLQVPTVAGAVVPVVNLGAGVDRPLQLTGEVLADLFAGHIGRWNDPRVAALNPGLRLPDLAVRRIVRADKSGTTDAFSSYLSLLSPAFASEVGASQLPQWPGQVLAADGNGGVVKLLGTTPGGITYTSYDRAKKDHLTMARLKNAAGQWADANERSITEALRASNVHRKGEDTASTLNMPGGSSWPITVVTFLLFDAAPARSDTRTLEALRFAYWAFQQGDRLVHDTGFVPLPISLQARLAGRLSSVRATDGQPLVLQ